MRELTDDEKLALRHGCLYCRQTLFWLGPQGGLSFNTYCTRCRAGFNITHYKLPWQEIAQPYERSTDEVAAICDGKMDIVNFFRHVDAAIEKAVREGFDKVRR